MKKLFLASLVSALSMSYANADPASTKHSDKSAPKNIIMVVGDGMGPVYTTAYRYFADNPNTKAIEQTVFDRHFVGTSSTYPAPISGYITDSAAAATALSTGVKTYNNAIAVDVDEQPLETVLERAKKLNKKTGIVVTSQINHATPASYLSHNEHRRNYNSIADSYLDDGIKADLMLGGGWNYFIRKKRNLVDEFKQAGFYYLDEYQELASLPSNTPILGLFDNKGLPWALDDSDKYRLSTMTKAAIKQLENKQGYFLLIEASQIDWAGHNKDIASAMAEMDDLAKTLEYLETYVQTNPNTTIVVTADHSTGGLSIGRKNNLKDDNIKSKYLWRPEYIRTIKASPRTIANNFVEQALSHEEVNDVLNFKLNHQEYTMLQSAQQEGEQVLKDYLALSKEQQKAIWKPSVASYVESALKMIIDEKTNTGWGSSDRVNATHTGIDVPVFAMGKNKTMFSGFQDNTDIAKKIFTLLK